MTLFQHYQLSLLLATAISAAIGIWAYFQKAADRRLTKSFCVYSLAVATWTFCQTQGTTANDPETSMRWARIMLIAVSTLPILLANLFSIFLKKPIKKVLIAGWIFCGASAVAILSGDAFLTQGRPIAFIPYVPQAGKFLPAFNLMWLGWVIYAFSLLARHKEERAYPTRRQARFLMISFVIGYLTGSLNFLYLYGITLPYIHPFCTYGVPITWFLFAYGVFVYDLFDTRAVIRKSLVYSLLITILTVGYFSLIHLTEQIFKTTLGYQSSWITLIAFATMAIAFQPLKIGIQRVIDLLVFKVPREELVKRVERLEEQALLSEKFKATSTLAAGMAHEIKNPLTAIKTFGEFLPERHNDLAFIKQCSETLKQETNRIHRIVQEVLDFAKPRLPQSKPVDLGPLIDSTVNLLSSELLKQKIQWQVDYQHDGHTAQVDPDQLRQVLINLIQNAADAMPDGGKLNISTQPVNGHLELTVSDTGEGIPKKLLPKIFDPFVTTKENGNGLGLAMVYSILRANHGTIRAENLPDKGSAFTVSLPT